MILAQYLANQGYVIPEKGETILARAIKDIFPEYDYSYFDDESICDFWVYRTIDEDIALKILKRALRYSKLWAFA